MIKKKHILLIATSFVIGIVGLALDLLYVAEEDAVLYNGGESGYYEFLKPLWEAIIRPLGTQWAKLWPEGIIQSNYGLLVAFLFWVIVGLLLSLVLSFIWSKLRKTAK